jgi:hypothetical protein
MICEKCAVMELKAMRALESLTPGGSEFVDDIERCVRFIRDSRSSQMNVLVKFKKRIDALEKELAERLGGQS